MTETMPNVTPIEILLIDDDESDVFLTKRAFNKAKMLNNVQVARDGEDALAMLRREGLHKNAKRPDLILLDLNMPRMNGHEFLEIVKADDDLKSVPVIVMTMSQSEADMMRSYQSHASSYISKPIELEQFMKVMQTIQNYWFAVVKLPQQRDNH